MKLGLSKLSSIIILIVLPITQVYASARGICNDATQTRYICCSFIGGWSIGPDCIAGPISSTCPNDTGFIARSIPPITILDECKKRGGSAVVYSGTIS